MPFHPRQVLMPSYQLRVIISFFWNWVSSLVKGIFYKHKDQYCLYESAELNDEGSRDLLISYFAYVFLACFSVFGDLLLRSWLLANRLLGGFPFLHIVFIIWDLKVFPHLYDTCPLLPTWVSLSLLNILFYLYIVWACVSVNVCAHVHVGAQRCQKNFGIRMSCLMCVLCSHF